MVGISPSPASVQLKGHFKHFRLNVCVSVVNHDTWSNSSGEKKKSHMGLKILLGGFLATAQT